MRRTSWKRGVRLLREGDVRVREGGANSLKAIG